MTTNQQIYADYGIQVGETVAIAEKFRFKPPYSQAQIDRIREIHALAKEGGITVKKFLATIEVHHEEPQQEEPQQEAEPAQEATRPAGPATGESFQLALTTTANSLTAESAELYSQVDRYCARNEAAVANAVLERFQSSPERAMGLIADKLGGFTPSFFPLAPTGAQLPSFEAPAAACPILGGTDSAALPCTYALLGGTDEYDETTQQEDRGDLSCDGSGDSTDNPVQADN
jgi:hypothetical protein